MQVGNWHDNNTLAKNNFNMTCNTSSIKFHFQLTLITLRLKSNYSIPRSFIAYIQTYAICSPFYKSFFDFPVTYLQILEIVKRSKSMLNFTCKSGEFKIPPFCLLKKIYLKREDK